MCLCNDRPRLATIYPTQCCHIHSLEADTTVAISTGFCGQACWLMDSTCSVSENDERLGNIMTLAASYMACHIHGMSYTCQPVKAEP